MVIMKTVHIEGLELKRTIGLSTFLKKWAICAFRVLSNHTLRVRSHCILYLVKDAYITVSDSAMSRVDKSLGVETDYIQIMWDIASFNSNKSI